MTGAAAEDETSAHWGTAPAVIAVLGGYLWVSIVLLPGLFVGIWRDPLAIILAAVPLLILAAGLPRRSSEALLLVGFPAALLTPAAAYPAIVASHVYGPIRFAAVACGLVAFLLATSRLGSHFTPPPPARSERLAGARGPMPEQWQRRFRVYRGLAVLAPALALALIYAANFDDQSRIFLRELFPGRVAAYTTLLNLGLLAFSLAIYRFVFLGVLRPHRLGDRELRLTLAQLRRQARARRPRPVFYLGVAVALALMLLLLVLRHPW